MAVQRGRKSIMVMSVNHNSNDDDEQNYHYLSFSTYIKQFDVVRNHKDITRAHQTQQHKNSLTST